jgi:drug/metabolite transporter (DMT)-like permease
MTSHTPAACADPAAFHADVSSSRAASAPGVWQIVAAGVAFSLLWTSAFVAGKVGLAHAGALSLLAVRFLLAGLLLGGLCRLLGQKLQLQHGWLHVLLPGLLSHGIYLGLAFTGMRSTPAGLTTLLVSTTPLLTAALAVPLLGEAASVRKFVGLLLGLLGVGIVVSQRAKLAMPDGFGLSCIALGTVVLSFGNILMKRVTQHDLLPVIGAQLFASGLLLLPFAWSLEGMRLQWAWPLLASLGYLAIVVSIGASLLWIWLLKHGAASSASSFHLLNPLFGALLASTFLAEPLYLSDALGALPIVAGIALVYLKRA